MTTKPAEVFLLLDYVHKRKGGISDLTMTWHVAKWIARGTGTVLYTSKQCGALKSEDAKREAIALAQKWLAKQNSIAGYPVHMRPTGPRYIDTTGGAP